MKTTTNETTADIQSRIIKQARILLEPQKVKVGALPKWLSKRMTAHWKARKQKRPSTFSLRETVADIAHGIGITLTGMGFLDHYGTATGGPYKCCNEAGECFVSEPYGFDTEYAKVLDAVESVLNVTWHVSPNSWHFPGRTIRITIHEPTPDCIKYRNK